MSHGISWVAILSLPHDKGVHKRASSVPWIHSRLCPPSRRLFPHPNMAIISPMSYAISPITLTKPWLHFKIIQMGVNLLRNWGCSNPPKMLPPKTPLQKTPRKTPQTSWGPMCRCVEVRSFRGQQFKYRLSSQNWDFTWFKHQIINTNWLK